MQVPFLSCAGLVWTFILSSIGGTAQNAAPAPEMTADLHIAALPSKISSVSDGNNDEEPAVIPVDAGEVNALIDEVSLADVQQVISPLKLFICHCAYIALLWFGTESRCDSHCTMRCFLHTGFSP